jgi:hypothetical protein
MPVRGVVAKVLLFVSLVFLLVAPLAISLIRFGDLYYFVHYSGYASLREYWDSSLQAVSTPVMVLAAVGIAYAMAFSRNRLLLTTVATLAIYVFGTALLSVSATLANWVSQLEPTRLMPFQRLLVIYLAAYGAYALVHASTHALAHRRALDMARDGAMLAMVGIVLVVYTGSALNIVPESDRRPDPLPMSDHPAIASLERAVRLATAEAPEGTSVLVLGTVISWHDQLWAPQWTNRRLFYDDWLWYWQRDHVGAYDPETSHAYVDDASTLTSEYLRHHGIGAIVVTGSAATAAARSPLLRSLEVTEWYSVYLVDDPAPVVRASGAEVEVLDFDDHSIAAAASQPVGAFEVRHNWFPRWRAWIDGVEATITRDDGGYMQITADEPGTALRLRYVVDTWDWLGRVLAGIGVLAVAGSLWGRPFDQVRSIGWRSGR